ncbi:metallophosphoesterase [Candidatus Binatia bacterium]|nr:metallophosphoesterase [Candidatus Binatia bacterium]
MLLWSNAAAQVRSVRRLLVGLFFANFFRLLLVAVSAAQWGMAWWLFPGAIGSLPVAAQLAAPVGVYGFNLALASRTRRERRVHSPTNALPRLYYAAAFTCLFCCLFLASTGVLWISARTVLGAVATQARGATVGVEMDRNLDSGFRWFANAGVAAIALAFLYGYTVGQRRLTVRHVPVLSRRLPAALDGLRIAQISDIHIGQNLRRRELMNFVARVNELDADIVCVTGDIADSPLADLESFLPILAGLDARRGVLAILGNHDHYAGADRVEAALRRLTRFVVLRDQSATIQLRQTRLHVIGLDDRGRDWARGVHEATALATAIEAVPAGEPVLLLCHRPDIFPQAAARGVALTLAGHTHGGQIGIPWFNGRVRNLAELVTRFDRGLFEHNGSFLYVNCGLGVTAQRIRLSTPREITLLELRHPDTRRSEA